MLRAFHLYLAWVWIIIVGGLMITPNGVFCIVCGPQAPGYLGTVAIRLVGVLTIVVGILGIATRSKVATGNRL